MSELPATSRFTESTDLFDNLALRAEVVILKKLLDNCNLHRENCEPSGTKYNRERLLNIHFERIPLQQILEVSGGKYLLIIPGGDGYTGVSLKIVSTPGSSQEIYIVDKKNNIYAKFDLSKFIK